MRLSFGPFKIDTKGLPAISSIHVDRPVSDGRPVMVLIALDSGKRAAVEKWAQRLGSQVTEELHPLYDGHSAPLDIHTVAESDGYRVEVYTRAAAPAANGGAR